MATYTITTTKGTRTADTIGNALRAAASDALYDASFGPSITRNDTDETVSFTLIDDDVPAMDVDDAQDLLRLAGVDPREDDADGFHWPYAPDVTEVAAALDRWTI